MENVIAGILLSFVISVISPFIEKKLMFSADKAKIFILVFISVCLAVISFYSGESFKRTFVEILGSASAYYQLVNKYLLDNATEKFVENRFLN